METGKLKWINTSSRKVRLNYEEYYRNLELNTKNQFKNAGAGFISFQNDEDYFKNLLNYFKSHNVR